MSYTRSSKSREQDNQGAQQSAGTAQSAIPQFMDNRATTATQLRQQQLMSSGSFAGVQLMLKAQMATSPVQQQKTIQRAAPEEELQMKATKNAAQLAGVEEELVQGKFSTPTAQREEKPNNTGLPDNLKSGIESLSGMSMDNVKVHYNSDKPAQLNAHAYAQGTDIHVAPGQEQHLPHEAWHVVQQAQGRVKPTMQMKAGVPVNDDVGLEGEADVMGAKALTVGSSGDATVNVQMKSSSESISTTSPVQLLPDIYSREAFADPGAYLANRFANSQINEDAGSGGIQDEPVRKLVLELAKPSRREVFAERLIAKGGTGPGLAATLTDNVYDRATAQTWVVQNTLAISTLVPWALTIENVVMDEAPQGPVHTFHRDHGKVVLTDAALAGKGVNSAHERTARRNVLNGPNGHGWVRGHYGVANKKHRFIDHIHVDKDAPGDGSFEIYDADSAAAGHTAAAFNLANRAGFTDGNNGRVDQAAVEVEGTAKRLSWEEYEGTLPEEVQEPVVVEAD